MSDAEAYLGRYPLLAERRGVWREIARWVERDAPRREFAVELGAGYCDFINQLDARRRVAFDLNPQMVPYADSGVDLRVGDATTLANIEPASVDLVFASNFLKHLDGTALERLLNRVREVLRPGGRIVLLQPNYRRSADNYFDDPTHQTVFDDQSLPRTLIAHGFRVLKVIPGLLPLSMKSKLPKWPILIRLYLNAPFRPLGAQMYVVAERS